MSAVGFLQDHLRVEIGARNFLPREMKTGHELPQVRLEPGSEDLMKINVFQIGAQPADRPLGGVHHALFRHSNRGNAVYRTQTPLQAVCHAPGERGVQQQELHGLPPEKLRGVRAPARLKRAARLQGRNDPRTGIIGETARLRMHGENPHSPVGPFDVAAKLDKLIGLPVHHRVPGDPVKRLGRFAHPFIELHRPAGDLRAVGPSDHEVQAVQLFPHFLADLFPDAAAVLAGPHDAPEDGIRVRGMPEEKITDVLGCERVAVLTVGIGIAASGDQGLPRGIRMLRIEHGMEVHCQFTRDTLRPLDVP